MTTRGIIATLGIAALVAAGIACSNGEAATMSESGAEQTAPAVQAPVAQPPAQTAAQPAQAVQAPATQPPAQAAARAAAPAGPATAPVQPQSGGGAAAAALQVPTSNTGIWVTGQANISVEPDLVLLNVGVETMAETVAEARGQAAQAMDAIITAVRAHGLGDDDVQTRSFNIWPRYEYPEVTSGGTSTRRQTLVGYTVNNTATIKIRDVDAVGAIIDDVAEAGGDATRIDGINFSIEDPKPFMTQLREEAVGDAIAKAEHLASLSGVAVGSLLYIREGGGTPVVRDFNESAVVMRAAAAPAAPTSISGGELKLNLTVQAVFSIE